MNDASCTRERERKIERDLCEYEHEYEARIWVSVWSKQASASFNQLIWRQWSVANCKHSRERERERRATGNLSTANEVINGAAPRRRVRREYENRELNPTLDVTIDRAGRLSAPNPRSVWSLPCCKAQQQFATVATFHMRFFNASTRWFMIAECVTAHVGEGIGFRCGSLRIGSARFGTVRCSFLGFLPC